MSTIVVGIDGSEGSRRALRWAIAEAEAHGASIDAVIAEPNGTRQMVQPVPGARIVPELPVEERMDRAREMLDEAVEKVLSEVGGTRVAVERRVIEGEPAEALIDASAGADMLVVGARGMGSVQALLLGSVSQACVSRAETPVVIIPPAMRVA